jgi:hypothetical protein
MRLVGTSPWVRPRAASWVSDLRREVTADPWQTVVVLAAVAYLGLFLVVAALRAIYPFPVDPIEAGALQEVRRVLTGQALYVAPSLDYVPYVYGPIYFYVAAAVATITGTNFLALRLVSIAASVASICLVAALVKRATDNWTAALVGAGLVVAASSQVNLALDSGRMDALALCFSLAAVYAAWSSTSRSAALSGCCMALAVLTKQTSLVIAAGLLIAIMLKGRRRVPAFILGFAAPLVAVTLGLMLQSGLWPLFYQWSLPRNHVVLPELLPRFWDDVLSRFTLPLLLVPLYFLGRMLAHDGASVRFWLPLCASMLLVAWISRANSGGDRNVDLPAYAALAILFALTLHEVLGRLRNAPPFRAFVLALAAVQFALLLTNPRLMVPYRSDVWAGQRLQSTLESLQAPIFAAGYGGFVDTPQVDPGALDELMGAYGGRITPEGQQWLAEYAAALRSRRFAYVIVDPDYPAFYLSSVATDNGYVSAGPLFKANDEFWAWRSGRTPRADVYIPGP